MAPLFLLQTWVWATLRDTFLTHRWLSFHVPVGWTCREDSFLSRLVADSMVMEFMSSATLWPGRPSFAATPPYTTIPTLSRCPTSQFLRTR
jgi:hypothetical protein